MNSAPTRGQICKITAMWPNGDWVYLELKGFSGKFNSSSFQPLQDRPTTTRIEVFRKLLVTRRVKEDV